MKNTILPAALCLACFAAVSPTQAQAPSASEIFSMRLQDSANSGNFATGDIIFQGANAVVPPDTSYGFTRQCPSNLVCTGPADPNMVRQALFWRPYAVQPGQYFASRPYDPNITGPWTLVLSSQPSFPNNPNTIAVNTPAIGAAASMPYVQSMSVSGAGLTPTISWTLPAAAPVDQMRVLVFDDSHPVTTQSRSPALSLSFQQGNLVYRTDPLPASQTSFQLPAAAGLQFGTHYSIAISMEHVRPGASGTGLSIIDTRSNSFFDFTPLNAGNANVYLPTTVPVPTTSGLVAGPLYSFTAVPAAAGTTTFIDPLVATGFNYAVRAGDPNFASVLLPAGIGNGQYQLYLWNGHDFVPAGYLITGGVPFSFLTLAPLGLDRFAIRGIDTSAGVNPFDLTAFVTGLTFVSDGTFNGTMEAVVADVVPEPETYALVLAGLALLGFRARRRRG
jgi:hypothetical protein